MRELTSVGRGDSLGDDFKALQGVHDLDDGERAEEEEDNLGDVLEGFLDVRLELSWGQVETSADSKFEHLTAWIATQIVRQRAIEDRVLVYGPSNQREHGLPWKGACPGPAGA